MTVYERGKPRQVSIDILKEFREDSGVHGFPRDPPHPAMLDEMREVPNLIPAPAVTHRAPTSSVGIGTGDERSSKPDASPSCHT